MEIKVWFDVYECKLMVYHHESERHKEIVKPAKIATFLQAHGLTLADCQYPVETMDHMCLFTKKGTFRLLKRLIKTEMRRD
ncbi:hypothetical protein IC620_14635 [Hazenella sp. IB182357]|uniref:Uncharacterized protein n=1 Tax=Polycladospora coralii TaxID=2771432 RepID=A0A926NBL4_9BACL|nr:hypothetical protein [Polycladospora coralii]MBD1373582.1 hypothetical protein [Polycladospora coralii]